MNHSWILECQTMENLQQKPEFQLRKMLVQWNYRKGVSGTTSHALLKMQFSLDSKFCIEQAVY